MVYEFKFPDVGEGITEGTLVEWKVETGSQIKTDESVASVETDKAVVDIPSPVTGTVKELLAQKGDTLEVGNAFMKIETNNEGESNSSENQENNNESYETPQESQNEDISGNNDISQDENSINTNNKEESKSLRNILAMPGVVHEAKKKGIDLKSVTPSGSHGQILMEDLEKSNMHSTTTQKNSVRDEDSLENKENQRYDKDKDSQKSSYSSSSNDNSSESEESTNTSAQSNPLLVASLSVKKLARELGVDINFVVGTGDNGRITAEDVKRAKENNDKLRNKTSSNTTNYSSQKEEDNENNEEYNENTQEYNSSSHTQENSQLETQTLESVPLKGIRGKIATKMKESLDKTAQITISDEIEISKLVEVREREKEKLKSKGIKLSYLPFIVKAVKHATRQYPQFNGKFNEENNTFEKYDAIHMGIAADTQKGLVVPVITNAQEKSIIELAKEITSIGEKAKEYSFSANELSGSTFTISSIGSIGAGQAFTSIINYPESAILGVGRIVDKPVINQEGSIVPGKTMTLSITIDHRIIDGADAARFLKDIMNLLKNPEELLLEA